MAKKDSTPSAPWKKAFVQVLVVVVGGILLVLATEWLQWPAFDKFAGTWIYGPGAKPPQCGINITRAVYEVGGTKGSPRLDATWWIDGKRLPTSHYPSNAPARWVSYRRGTIAFHESDGEISHAGFLTWQRPNEATVKIDQNVCQIDLVHQSAQR